MEDKKKKKIIIIIVLLFVCIFAGLFAWYFLHTSPDNNLKEDINAVGYNPKLEKPKNFDSNQIALPGFSEITVNEGDKVAHVALANPSFNSVYFKYIVTFDETGEKMLETDLIAPGKAVKKLPLPKNLSVGTHTVTIKVDTYDKKTKAKLNGGSNQVALIVEKFK
ncbi:hypothetical protein ACTPL8_002821 [Enterococcus faecium]